MYYHIIVVSKAITLWGLSFEVKVSLPYHVCFIEMYYHIIVVSEALAGKY
jgi:hypothetical protein